MRQKLSSCVSRALLLFAPVALAAQPNPPQRALVEDMRIDGVKEDLTFIEFILIDASGRIAVSQMEDFRILFFGADGRRLASFGKEGQGPGEFSARGAGVIVAPDRAGGVPRRSAKFIGGLVGDTAWFYDTTRPAFTFVSMTGGFLRSARLPGSLPTLFASNDRVKAVDPLLSFFSPLAVYPDGDLLGRAAFDRVDGRVPDISVGISGYEFARANQNGTNLRRLGRFPDIQSSVEVSRNNGDYGIAGHVPFLTDPDFNVAQNGSRMAMLIPDFHLGAHGEARLIVLSARGDTLLSRQYPFNGKAIPRSEIDARIQDQVRSHLTSSRPPPGHRQMVADLEKELVNRAPAFRSPFRTVQLGLDDTVWLRLSWGVTGDSYFLMLDGKGEPIATITLPPRTNLLAANRTHIWTRAADADGLGSVVRFRIQAP